MPRASRKDSILEAALACFSEHGVEATTIEMIRERSGASIGSLYHHFGNKERILAALYVAGTEAYHGFLQDAWQHVDGAQSAVETLVGSYIDWVGQNPDWARFLLHCRGRVEAGEQGDTLRQHNREHFLWIERQLKAYREQGLLRELPRDVFTALLIGPTQDYMRHWLAGRVQTPLEQCRPLLAQAAWMVVKA